MKIIDIQNCEQFTQKMQTLASGVMFDLFRSGGKKSELIDVILDQEKLDRVTERRFEDGIMGSSFDLASAEIILQYTGYFSDLGITDGMDEEAKQCFNADYAVEYEVKVQIEKLIDEAKDVFENFKNTRDDFIVLETKKNDHECDVELLSEKEFNKLEVEYGTMERALAEEALVSTIEKFNWDREILSEQSRKDLLEAVIDDQVADLVKGGAQNLRNIIKGGGGFPAIAKYTDSGLMELVVERLGQPVLDRLLMSGVAASAPKM